jgi:hypothetical protein
LIINLFSPWCNWKTAELVLNNYHSSPVLTKLGTNFSVQNRQFFWFLQDKSTKISYSEISFNVFLDKHILFIYFQLSYVFLDKPILFIYFLLSCVILHNPILFIYFQLSYSLINLFYLFIFNYRRCSLIKLLYLLIFSYPMCSLINLLFIYFQLSYVFLDKHILYIYFQLSYVFLDIFVQELFPELRGWTTYTYCIDLLCNQISFWHFLFKSVLTTSNIYVLYCVSCHNGLLTYYPLANEVAKGYSNATVRPSVTSLWTL